MTASRHESLTSCLAGLCIGFPAGQAGQAGRPAVGYGDGMGCFAAMHIRAAA
jgi:hypothetical protein